MLYVWLLGMVVSLLNIKRNDSKFRWIEIGCLVVIMSCNNLAGDEVNLYQDYQKFFRGTHEVYDVTSYFFSELLARPLAHFGASFGIFNFVLIAVSFFLIDHALQRCDVNKSVVYLMFSLTSALLDATLMRQFVAFAVALYAFSELMQEKIKMTRYITLIVLSTCIHFSMIVFLLYVTINLGKKQVRWFCAIITFLLLVIVYMNDKRIPGLDFILRVFGGVKFTYYSTTGGVNYGWLYTLIIWLLMVLVSNIIFRDMHACTDDLTYIRIVRIDYLILLSGILVTFSMITMIYSRLMRPVSWLLFMEISYWYKFRGRIVRKRRISVATLYVIAFLAIYGVVYNHVIFDYQSCGEKVLQGIPFWNEDYLRLMS